MSRKTMAILFVVNKQKTWYFLFVFPQKILFDSLFVCTKKYAGKL